MHHAPPTAGATDRLVANKVGTAHAKAILLGEHAAVYGAPAVAIPVHSLTAQAWCTAGNAEILASDLYSGPIGQAPASLAPVVTAWRAATRSLRIESAPRRLILSSTIPVQRGLGSSAAVAAAVIDAVARDAGVELDTRARHQLIQEAETVAHGKPSGIDAASVVARGPIRFEQGIATELPTGGSFTLVIADTGAPGSTSQAVGYVRDMRRDHPRRVDAIIGRLAELSRSAQDALAVGSTHALGEAMDEAHGHLGTLGVDSEALLNLVTAARRAGAAGAKLTGGGLGGCVIALSADGETEHLTRALREAGAIDVWTTTVEAAA
ncbi:MAG TPA: mevalonate kinase [Candidatus Brachybacterium merdigallinarum]|nr:mevalonate kinase [Candidatus Brachybacterium merdigallinarum]